MREIVTLGAWRQAESDPPPPFNGNTILPCVIESNLGQRALVLEATHDSYLEISESLWRAAAPYTPTKVFVWRPYEWQWLQIDADFIESHLGPISLRWPWLIVRDPFEPPSGPLVLEPAPSTTPYTHLHTHSEMSALDGYSTITEIVELTVADGAGALAITDHGVCSGHAELATVAADAGIKPIFGLEAYFVDDRLWRPMSKPPKDQIDTMAPDEAEKLLARWTEEQKRGRDYWHLVLWAETDEGLRNLWRIHNESHRPHSKYYKPRLDWEVLERYGEGVIASTACLRGPLTTALLADNDDLAISRLGRLRAIFGDRLYAEIHTNGLDQQVEANRRLVGLAQSHGIPLVAVSDSHYPTPAHKQCHQVWLAVQTNSDLTDDTDLFAGNHDYHLLRAAEARQALAYLGPAAEEAIANTNLVADRCNASIIRRANLPVFSRRPTREESLQRDLEKFFEQVMDGWRRKVAPKIQRNPEIEQTYLDRLATESRMIIEKGFVGYFLMVADYCNFARDNGILVGPGRGSGGGCLIAWLMGITGIDAVEADLLFSRFLTSGRVSLPDFDVDFPSSSRAVMTQYVIDKYGADHVIRIVTHTRVRNKEAVKSIARALKGTLDIPYTDIEAINKIITKHQAGTAGLGLTWDELMESAGSELAVYIARWPLLFQLVESTVGRLKTYGKHAAGLLVSPDEPIEDSMPVTYDDEGNAVSSWDMNVLDSLNYLKIDLLTLRNLDTLQLAIDLIRERHGVTVRFDEWDEEYRDQEVWAELCAGHTLGVFQFETPSVTSLTRRLQPRDLYEGADVITLVRPGPDRAGLTDQYIERKHGRLPVFYDPPALEPHLRKTYGTMIYQEQVMAATMVLAGYDDNRADGVRKILGKKKVSATIKAGEEFVEAARLVGTISDHEATSLWSQMAEFAKYCLTGDTQVSLASGNTQGDTVSIELLWRRLHTPLRDPVRGRTKTGEEFSGPCDVCGVVESHHWARGRCNACYVWLQKFRDPKRGLSTLGVFADGRIRPARILDVVAHGPGMIFRVELADGKVIRSTVSHKHLTDQWGFVPVSELRVGDRLVVDGGYEETPYDSAMTRLTVGSRQLVGAVAGHYGQANIGYIDGGHARLTKWYESVEQFCADCGHDGTISRLEKAHLNGDRKDNSPDNLRLLCASCHKKHDYSQNGRRRRWEKGHPVVSVEIISIEPDGIEGTYDLVVDTPHNFVANGVVTSNSFNQAHAYGYAVLAHWCAWLKVHYPIEFLTALLSSVNADRIADFIAEARRLEIAVLPPDINTSGAGFTVVGDSTIRYGLGAVPGIGDATVALIEAGAPYSSIDDFMERSKVDTSSTLKLVQIGAFDSIAPHRAALERYVSWVQSGENLTCRWKNEAVAGPNGLPCVFDWSTIPIEMTALGRPKKNQPGPPKRCTKACRSYTLPEEPAWGPTTPRMTPIEIRQRERKVLGVYLSSTPFDDIDPDDLARCLTFDQMESVPADGREWITVGEVARIKNHTDKSGNTMAFLDLAVRGGTVSVTVFASIWSTVSSSVSVGSLVFLAARRNERGWTVSQLQPVVGSA